MIQDNQVEVIETAKENKWHLCEKQDKFGSENAFDEAALFYLKQKKKKLLPTPDSETEEGTD